MYSVVKFGFDTAESEPFQEWIRDIQDHRSSHTPNCVPPDIMVFLVFVFLHRSDRDSLPITCRTACKIEQSSENEEVVYGCTIVLVLVTREVKIVR